MDINNTIFAVIDTTNHLIRGFSSYQSAHKFCIVNGRLDWKIVPYSIKSTIRQQNAIHFCEQVLNISFTGDINNKQECSYFLSKYLEQAKQFYIELKCEYETDRGY